MPLRFCFIMLLIMSGLVIICSCADFCSDFWLNTPVSCAAAGAVRGTCRRTKLHPCRADRGHVRPMQGRQRSGGPVRGARAAGPGPASPHLGRKVGAPLAEARLGDEAAGGAQQLRAHQRLLLAHLLQLRLGGRRAPHESLQAHECVVRSAQHRCWPPREHFAAKDTAAKGVCGDASTVPQTTACQRTRQSACRRAGSAPALRTGG
jgi:hypothetical protein